MTRTEYVEECQALADSFDSHVTTEDVLLALDLLMNRIESEGITNDEDGDE